MLAERVKTFFSNDGILIAKVVNYDIDNERFTIEPIRTLTENINNAKQVIVFDLEHNKVYRLSNDLKLINQSGIGAGLFYKTTRLCIRANKSSKLNIDCTKFMILKDKNQYNFNENYRNQYNRIFNTIIDRIL